VTSGSLDFAGENLLRDLAPQVLGAVIRRFGDFSAGEDVALEVALAVIVETDFEVRLNAEPRTKNRN